GGATTNMATPNSTPPSAMPSHSRSRRRSADSRNGTLVSPAAKSGAGRPAWFLSFSMRSPSRYTQEPSPRRGDTPLCLAGKDVSAGAGADPVTMKIVPVPRIAGALLFEPAPHRDERGFFCRTADADVLREAGLDPAAFVQDSVSRSARGVLRGLHLRSGDGEAKLVRCSSGAIFDVIVDLRPGSPTYRNTQSFRLDG